jgi:HD-GYP domain-containing protein (c-di-GMP phosphodiesterase class II)
LRNIVRIAGAHHEKLNGRGYPYGLSGDAIPLQSRIMAIADVYDALTASDRPYKRAVSTEQALRILHDEVTVGFLDADLLDLFTAQALYEVVRPGARAAP